MGRSNTATAVKDIRRNTRRKFSTEEQLRIVLDGLRGESWIAELCRREASIPICLDQRAIIKSRTMRQRKLHHLQLAG